MTVGARQLRGIFDMRPDDAEHEDTENARKEPQKKSVSRHAMRCQTRNKTRANRAGGNPLLFAGGNPWLFFLCAGGQPHAFEQTRTLKGEMFKFTPKVTSRTRISHDGLVHTQVCHFRKQ